MVGPVIIHIPHASDEVPEDERHKLLPTGEELQSELLRLTDWYTDELFDLRAEPCPLVFPVSRLVCDPERFPNDADEPMAEKGMGAVYTRTSDGNALRQALDNGERERILEQYYCPHHRRFERLVREALEASGYGLIIDGHSFPSSPLPCDLDQTPHRPDICIGTDVFHTPDWLQQAAVAAFSDLGWHVEVNRPYSGTIVPAGLYRVDQRVHSIMVEINRSLYMNEETSERSAEFGEVGTKIRSALDTIIATVR